MNFKVATLRTAVKRFRAARLASWIRRAHKSSFSDAADALVDLFGVAMPERFRRTIW
jgi:hypothetical protein